MNKLALSLAGIAIVFAATSMDAQARGTVVGGFSIAPVAPAGHPAAGAPSSDGSAGTTQVGSTSASGVKMTTFANSVRGAGQVNGFTLSSNANGGNSSGSSGSLQLNSNGTISHASAASTSGTSLLASQSLSGTITPGVGNSWASRSSRGIGNSQASLSSQGIGDSGYSQAAAGGDVASLVNHLSHVMNTITGNGPSTASAITSVQTPKFGAQPVKACASGSGASTACN
jgi:hypothetical protein